jgi:chromosome segregation and condensation protein ScpB
MAATKTPYFLTLERNKQCKALEALIFASDDPLTVRDLFRFLILEDFNQQTTVADNGEEPAPQEDLWGTFTPEIF